MTPGNLPNGSQTWYCDPSPPRIFGKKYRPANMDDLINEFVSGTPERRRVLGKML